MGSAATSRMSCVGPWTAPANDDAARRGRRCGHHGPRDRVRRDARGLQRRAHRQPSRGHPPRHPAHWRPVHWRRETREARGSGRRRRGRTELGLEAIRRLEQGVASAEDIDKAMELGYNHPMGPLKLTDLVGLDVRLAIAEYLYRTLEEPQFEPPQILKNKVAKGELGKKTGKGFYSWP